MSSKIVLVVGGAGFIGSHVTKMLVRAGYQPLVFDNLCRGTAEAVQDVPLIQGDLARTEDIHDVFQRHEVEAVMHFAAYADVGESFSKPLEYYTNNVTHTLNLLSVMLHHNVRRLIFSSSAAIFGLPQQKKISEQHPCDPISPYGQTKLIIEKILQDFDRVYGFRHVNLRYFNAAGGDPQGEVKQRKKREYNLLPVVLRSLLAGHGCVTINGSDYPTGDGTCVRDYVHVHDIGKAHMTALEQLLEGRPSMSYNLGNGEGFSIRQVIAAIEQVTGRTVSTVEGPRRHGDPPVLVADASKAMKELNWKPEYSQLETMILHAWRAFQ